MSCKPATREIYDTRNSEVLTTQGFIFAFYHYSHSNNKSFIETIVSVATASDCIHVAIVPVPECKMQKKENPRDCVIELNASPEAYTAFIGHGFEIQSASSLLNDAYEFIFVPVTALNLQRGVNLLKSFDGAGYNYIDLPLTILPKRLKKNRNNAFSDKTDSCMPSRVFCSQVGMILCYQCNIINSRMGKGMIDPAYCTPADLLRILSNETISSFPCNIEKIKIQV